MSDTTAINMINLEVVAQDALDADTAAGTTTTPAGGAKDYSWHSQWQTIPVGMEHQPEAYALQLRVALPQVNTLRIAFNAWSFDADGNLHPEFEQFLTAAARQGFRFVFDYADNDAQMLNADGSMTAAEARAALTGPVHDRMVGAWTTMLDWLDRHGDVDAAVYGLEVINEPAGYANAQRAAGEGGAFVQLYGQHVAELAALIDARSDAKVLVDGWGYAQNFNSLAQIRTADGQSTVLDQIRAAVSDDLVWSAHLYPEWTGNAGQSTEGIAAVIDGITRILGSDDIILTETNGEDSHVNSLAVPEAFWLARAWEVLVDRGIGIGWFPGADVGASSFVSIDRGTLLRFYHPDSYAHGMNAFLLGADDPAHAGAEAMAAGLIAGRVMDGTKTIPGLDGIALAAGFGGNDTLTGIERAVNMLYGGAGDDLLLGSAGRDHLFGQGDNDTLQGGAGDDVLLGGAGHDVLEGGTGSDILTGGAGADLFSFADGGDDMISDFYAADGDRLLLEGRVWTRAEIDAAATDVDFDGDGAVDDVLVSWSGGDLAILNYSVIRPDGTVHGTAGADTIAVGYRDAAGDAFSWKGGAIDAGAGNDTVTGSVSADVVWGGKGSDSIDGRAGDDVLHGEDGRDTLLGGGGNDTLTGGTGLDSLDGGDGNDSLVGGSGADTIMGGSGNDMLLGSAGDDLLDGGYGLNTIDGGSGNDRIEVAMTTSSDSTLTGGAGADVFAFRSTWFNGLSRAVITDYDGADDVVMIGDLQGFAQIMTSRNFHGFTDVGTDVQMSFGDDVYVFLNHSAADLLQG